MAILIFFIFLQIADGFFTFHGVREVGIDKYELNPLLIFYMHRFGVVGSLVAAKLAASSLGYILYREKVFAAFWLLVGFYLNNFILQVDFFFRYNG